MQIKENDPLFDVKKFDIRLETEWLGRNFIYFEELESTNTYLSASTERLKNGTIVMAEKQFKGKGRLDRTWLSAKGENLTFSVLLNDKQILGANPAMLNFGTAIAVANSIETVFQIKTNLKWPNDVLVGLKKIAGILIESAIHGSKMTKMIVGIGININQVGFRGEYMLEPTSVAIEAGAPGERERFFAEFLNQYEAILYRVAENPGEILNAWREKCNLIGDKVGISQGGKTIYGIFDDIDDDGNLLLRQADKTLKINYGDVSLIL